MRREELVEKLKTADKKLRKRKKRSDRRAWFGLGLFGLIGWSVALPTVIGAGLGVYIDSRFGSDYSWTLILLVGGLILGCLNAWFWVSKERKAIIEENEENE